MAYGARVLTQGFDLLGNPFLLGVRRARAGGLLGMDTGEQVTEGLAGFLALHHVDGFGA